MAWVLLIRPPRPRPPPPSTLRIVNPRFRTGTGRQRGTFIWNIGGRKQALGVDLSRTMRPAAIYVLGPTSDPRTPGCHRSPALDRAWARIQMGVAPSSQVRRQTSARRSARTLITALRVVLTSRRSAHWAGRRVGDTASVVPATVFPRPGTEPPCLPVARTPDCRSISWSNNAGLATWARSTAPSEDELTAIGPGSVAACSVRRFTQRWSTAA